MNGPIVIAFVCGFALGAFGAALAALYLVRKAIAPVGLAVRRLAEAAAKLEAAQGAQAAAQGGAMREAWRRTAGDTDRPVYDAGRRRP